MTLDLNKLLEQRKELDSQIIAHAEQKVSEVVDTLKHLSDITKKHVLDLINIEDKEVNAWLRARNPNEVSLEATTNRKKKPRAKNNQDKNKQFMADWRKENLGKTFQGSNGKQHKESGFGRYPDWLFDEIKNGTLREVTKPDTQGS